MKIDDKILGSVKMTFWKSNTIIIGKVHHAIFSSKYFTIETIFKVKQTTHILYLYLTK